MSSKARTTHQGGHAEMRTYVAFSTENFEMNSITILALGGTKSEAEAQGREMLPSGIGLVHDTWLKNFRVLSETQTKKLVGTARYRTALDNFLAALEG